MNHKAHFWLYNVTQRMLSLNPKEPPKQKLLWNFEILVQLSLKRRPSAQAFHTWNSMITTAATVVFFITCLLGRVAGTLRTEDMCTAWVVIFYYYGGWDSLSCSGVCELNKHEKWQAAFKLRFSFLISQNMQMSSNSLLHLSSKWPYMQ